MPTAPAFWWTARPGPAAGLLRPLGALYGAVAARRMGRPSATLPVPVVCVGNLVVGGAGKTPLALAVAAALRDAGHRPAFLSRGYGRDRPGGAVVLHVDPDRDGAARAGDEPLLLARVAPTFVSGDRLAAARAAIAAGASVLVLDDGLQNPALAKTLALAAVDGATGFGNGRCLPAGPLRAPLAAQWPHVAALCVVGPGAGGEAAAGLAAAQGRAVLHAELVPDPVAIEELRGAPLLAFAGIGRPGKFFATLRATGLEVAAQRAFPDHHRYAPGDLHAMRRDADALGARLVTTAKDRVRLPADFPTAVLPVRLRTVGPDALAQLLATVPGLGATASPARARTGTALA